MEMKPDGILKGTSATCTKYRKYMKIYALKQVELQWIPGILKLKLQSKTFLIVLNVINRTLLLSNVIYTNKEY